MKDDFDVTQLLKPISTESPSGIDIRQNITSDSLYQQIKSMRAKVRTQEREMASGSSDIDNVSVRESWKKIGELSQQVLSQQAKDLEVAAWLTEAMARLKDFPGLGDSFSLMRQLVESFWDQQLYPLPDEDGVETRLAAITGLNGESANGTLIAPIYCIPLTRTSVATVSAWNYQRASEPLKEGEEDSSNNDNKLTLGAIQAAALESGGDFGRKLVADIQYAVREYQSLCELLEKKCGISDAPPSSRIQNALNFCLETARKMYENFLKAQPVSVDSSADDQSNSNSSFDRKIHTVGSRQAALQQLTDIAAYFRDHEPNSPVSYLVDQAVRWGSMPLPELLSEIINDEAVLRHSYQLVGIKNTPSD